MAKRNTNSSKPAPAVKRQKPEASKSKATQKSSISPPAVKEEEPALKPTKLLFAMDYGTKTMSLAYRFVIPGEEASLQNTPNVHFSEKEYHAPQKVAWSADGVFYWGYAIDRAEKERKIEPGEVIELFKLCLYEEHKGSDMANLVERQLETGNRTLHELISTHLKAIIHDAKDWIKRRHKSEYSEEFIDSLPTQLLLSVPQMWNSPANLEMTEAAKDAGIGAVQIVFEPQCGVAFYSHMTKDEWPREIDAGDNIIVCDPGGGTGDFASYEFMQGSDTGATVMLSLIKAKGQLCGSEFVNQNFIGWLKKGKAGDFKTMCKELGLSETACMKQASNNFQNYKESFSVVTEDKQWVNIRGVQGAKRELWNIPLTGHDIEGFFRPVVAKIFDCMDSLRTERTKVILITGGFGRSEYLLDRLKERFKGINIQGRHTPAIGIHDPVARGAHLRYHDIVDHGMPANESFGIAQVEIYDPDLHPDATYFHDDRKANGQIHQGKPVMRPDYVATDPYSGEKIVYERWCPILKQGQLKVPGKAISNHTWQQHIVRQGDHEMSVQVYWTQKKLKEHAPIRNGADGRSTLIPGIKEWREPQTKTLPDLAKLGFELIMTDNGDMVYEIYYRLLIQCDGANIMFKWQIASPETPPFDENGEPSEGDIKFMEEEDFELSDATFNPFPRTAAN